MNKNPNWKSWTHTDPHHLVVTLSLALTALLSQNASAQDTSGTAPLQVGDVLRATQMGAGPAPAGAPGNGRYSPPMPANPALPTLWLIAETRAQNATPIICSLTPRKRWSADGKQFIRDNGTHAAWAGQVAKATNTPFVLL